ncbi:peptidase MA family metallohydrolase [bacterium]
MFRKKCCVFFMICFFLISGIFSFFDDSFRDNSFNNEDLEYFSQRYESKFRPFFDTWSVWNTFYFDIYYYSEEIAMDVINNIDEAYMKIINDLGYLFFYNPRRIKIYIYEHRLQYAYKTYMDPWTGGFSDLKKSLICTYEQRDLMKHIIVHELTHLIFDAYMGYPRRINIDWIHEGLAVFEENIFYEKKWNLGYLKRLDKVGQLLSLRQAFKTNTHLEPNIENIRAWYLQMGALIYYLVSLGQEGFRVFCHNMKRYKNIDEALSATYPWEFKNVEDLDKSWKKWLNSQEDYC